MIAVSCCFLVGVGTVKGIFKKSSIRVWYILRFDSLSRLVREARPSKVPFNKHQIFLVAHDCTVLKDLGGEDT